MFNLLWTALIGLLIGAVAKLIMPGKDPGGIAVTTILGIGGSFLAGFFGHAVGWYRVPGSGPGIIASAIGALVILGIYRMAVGRGLGPHDQHFDRPARTPS